MSTEIVVHADCDQRNALASLDSGALSPSTTQIVNCAPNHQDSGHSCFSMDVLMPPCRDVHAVPRITFSDVVTQSGSAAEGDGLSPTD